MRRSVESLWAGTLKMESVLADPFEVLARIYHLCTDKDVKVKGEDLPAEVLEWAGMDQNEYKLFRGKSSNQVLRTIWKIRQQLEDSPQKTLSI